MLPEVSGFCYIDLSNADIKYKDGRAEKLSDNSQSAYPVSVQSEDDYQVVQLEDETETQDNAAAMKQKGNIDWNLDGAGAKNTAAQDSAGAASSASGDSSSGMTFKEFKAALSCDSDKDEVAADYGYRNLFDIIDADGDGVITDDEIAALSTNAEAIDELTVDDIKNIAKLAGLPSSEEIDASDKADSYKNIDDIVEKIKQALGLSDSDDDEVANAVSGTSGSSGTSGVSGSSGASGGGGTSSGTSSTSASSSDDPEKMTLDELYEEQQVKQANLDSANSDLQAVKSGENDEVKVAVDKADELQEAYETALENDEKVSEELKTRQQENRAAIEEQENIVIENEMIITEAKSTIYDCETQIGLLENQISALQSSLSNLPSKTSDNEDKWSDIDAMEKSIKEQIEALESSKAEYEETKSDAQGAKSDAEDARNAAQKELKDNLYPERDEIEREILDTCSDETKKALELWQEARENIETVKAEQLETAASAVETAQGELEEVLKSIKELESAQIQLKNRVGSDGEDVVAFAESLDGLTASEMQKLMSAAGCQFDSGAWCADFVAYVTKEVIGSDSEFLSTCSNTAYCPTIASWASSKGILSNYGDSSGVEPGDYIIYYSDSKGYYHIGIVTSVNSDGTVNTIEGNTSDDNGSYTSGVVNTHSNRTGCYVKVHELD